MGHKPVLEFAAVSAQTSEFGAPDSPKVVVAVSAQTSEYARDPVHFSIAET